LNHHESHSEGIATSAQHLYIDTRASTARITKPKTTLRTLDVSRPTWRHSQALNMLIFEQDPCLAGEPPASLTIHALIGTLLTPSPSDSARGSILEAHGLHVSFVTLPLTRLNGIAPVSQHTVTHFHTCLHKPIARLCLLIWSSVATLFLFISTHSFAGHQSSFP
jgi:hypothetical protein